MQSLLSLLPTTLGMQLLYSFLTLLVFGILYFTWKIILVPYIGMQFYKKQGVPCEYFPLIGSFKNLIPGFQKHGDILHYLKHQARTKPKKLLCTNIGSKVALSLYDSALVKDFYLNTDNYIKDPSIVTLFEPLFGRGLLTSEGNQWKGQRKALSSAFHFEFLKSILPTVQATARQKLSALGKGSLTKVNVMNELQKITGEVVGKVFFGEQLSDYDIDGKPLTLVLADLIAGISKAFGEPVRMIFGNWIVLKGMLPRYKRLMRNIKQFREVCSKIVQNRTKAYNDQKEPNSSSHKDLLQILLEGKMSEEEIIDQFVTFFFAGMDTTGHLLTMVVYYLDKYPELKTKMLEEIQTYYKPEQTITQENLNKMEFTLAFIKETLRAMTPVAGVFMRRVAKDHKLGDIHLREGDMVNLDYFYNSYNPAYFDDVDDFKPERWLDKSKPGDAFAFTPFSGGARNCIGQHLALNESRIILGELLSQYDLKIPEDFKLKMITTFLYEPVEPILIDLIPRT